MSNGERPGTNVELECQFLADGRVKVRRLHRDGRWQPVEQGRQWQDDQGRHILIMINGRVHTLTLHPTTLTWTLDPLANSHGPI